MAGYRHKIPRVTVAFEEGHDFHGCEVVLRKLTLGEYLDIAGLNPDSPVRNMADQVKTMGNKILSWNLEDPETGDPIPVTSEAVLEQDMDLMAAVLTAWLDVLNGVSAPLEQNSSGGEPSLEASIPMETLSSSLVS